MKTTKLISMIILCAVCTVQAFSPKERAIQPSLNGEDRNRLTTWNSRSGWLTSERRTMSTFNGDKCLKKDEATGVTAPAASLYYSPVKGNNVSSSNNGGSRVVGNPNDASQPSSHSNTKPVKRLTGGDTRFSPSPLPQTKIIEKALIEHCTKNTGKVIPPDKYRKKAAKRNEWDAVSIIVAKRLESIGYKAFNYRNNTKMALFCKKVKSLPSYRKINIISAVANQQHKQYRLDLKYYFTQNPYCRTWVFTLKERQPFENIRVSLDKLNSHIRKLSDRKYMKDAGVEIVFRSSELGSEKHVDGVPTVHVHAHVIVKMDRVLPPEEWSILLSKVHRHWDGHFSDQELIKDGDAISNYIIKPNYLMRITNPELKVLYEQTFGAKLIQAMGSFKKLRKTLKDNKEKVVVDEQSGKPAYRIMKSWDRLNTKSGPKSKIDDEDSLFPDKVDENQILTIRPPTHESGPISEPHIIIKNFNPDTFQLEGLARWVYLFARDAYTKGCEELKNQYPDDPLSSQ